MKRQHPLDGVLTISCLIGLVFVADHANAQRRRRPNRESTQNVLALVGGQIHTQTAAGVVEGVVLIRDGKIVDVGPDVNIPRQARRIDAGGMTITPGLIDARSTLWLTASAAREGASDGGLDALDGVDLFSEDWQEVSRQGVTAVYVQPSSSGNLGGAGAVLRVAPAKTIDDLVLRRDSGAQAALGVGARSETSRSRFAQYERIKRALNAAKSYGEKWKEYEEYQQKKAEEKDSKDTSSSSAQRGGEGSRPAGRRGIGQRGGPQRGTGRGSGPRGGGPPRGGPSSGPNGNTQQESDEDKEQEQDGDKKEEDKPPRKPTRDRAKDFLVKVLQRKVPLRIEAHRDDDLANAIKLATEFDIRLVLDGVSVPGSALDDVVQNRFPLVLGPVMLGQSRSDLLRRRPADWLPSLTSSDVLFALSPFGSQPRASMLLRAHAASAVAAGVPADRALRAVTRDAAVLLGIDDQVGSIQTGQLADIAVFAGHPLDPSSRTRLVLSRGEIVYESEIEHTPKVIQQAQKLADRLPPVYAIRSERFLNEQGKFAPGQLVVENGSIASFGPATELPEDISVFDLGATVVTPGLMTAHTDLGLADLIDDDREANTADLRAADVYDPAAYVIKRLRDEGVLVAAFAPGSENVISGNVACVRLGAEQPIRSSTMALKIVLTSDSRDADRFPASLAGQVDLAQRVLSGRDDQTTLRLPDAAKAELLAERGKQIRDLPASGRAVLIEASTFAEIRAALRLVDRFRLRAALINPEQFQPLLDEIKRLDVGIIARPVTSDDLDRYLGQIVAANQAGVPVSFAADSPEECRLTAALAVGLGLPPEAALRGLTSSAAEMVGAPQNVCRFATGGPADFVVWDGSPLDLCRKPIRVVIDGAAVSGDR